MRRPPGHDQRQKSGTKRHHYVTYACTITPASPPPLALHLHCDPLPNTNCTTTEYHVCTKYWVPCLYLMWKPMKGMYEGNLRGECFIDTWTCSLASHGIDYFRSPVEWDSGRGRGPGADWLHSHPSFSFFPFFNEQKQGSNNQVYVYHCKVPIKYNCTINKPIMNMK